MFFAGLVGTVETEVPLITHRHTRGERDRRRPPAIKRVLQHPHHVDLVNWIDRNGDELSSDLCRDGRYLLFVVGEES